MICGVTGFSCWMAFLVAEVAVCFSDLRSKADAFATASFSLSSSAYSVCSETEHFKM